jgi:hypothetical protein
MARGFSLRKEYPCNEATLNRLEKAKETMMNAAVTHRPLTPKELTSIYNTLYYAHHDIGKASIGALLDTGLWKV